MVTNYAMSKDEIYGPPPAYSLDPPPSIYTISSRRNEYQERPLSSSHISMILSLGFLRYLLGSGVLHILIGVTAVICDILLIGMNESYSFNGLWAGLSCIILGIYLILFMSNPEKRKCSLHRFKFVHIFICIIIIVALVFSSLNLASNSCSTVYYQFDQCQQSAQKFKIVLVTFFAFSFVQICITFIVSFVFIT
jgi:hypothetical protein